MIQLYRFCESRSFSYDGCELYVVNEMLSKDSFPMANLNLTSQLRVFSIPNNTTLDVRRLTNQNPHWSSRHNMVTVYQRRFPNGTFNIQNLHDDFGWFTGTIRGHSRVEINQSGMYTVVTCLHCLGLRYKLLLCKHTRQVLAQARSVEHVKIFHSCPWLSRLCVAHVVNKSRILVGC